MRRISVLSRFFFSFFFAGAFRVAGQEWNLAHGALFFSLIFFYFQGEESVVVILGSESRIYSLQGVVV